MNYSTEDGSTLEVIDVFRVKTSKLGAQGGFVKHVAANSAMEALEIITPYLENNEEVTMVSKLEDISIYARQGTTNA